MVAECAGDAEQGGCDDFFIVCVFVFEIWCRLLLCRLYVLSFFSLCFLFVLKQDKIEFVCGIDFNIKS
jgi:hypothetical protein